MIILIFCVISSLIIQSYSYRDCNKGKAQQRELVKKDMPIIIDELIFKVDKNKDRSIDKNELKSYLDGSRNLPWYIPKGFAVDKIFEAIDFGPSDGRITEKELIQKEKLVEENLQYLQ